MSPAQRALRVDSLFRPYHDAIRRALDDRQGRPSLLLSVHSFTPVLDGKPRPWQVGVSARRDRRLASRLIAVLSVERDLTVGDDQPYPIEDDFDYTLPAHGEASGIPCAMIEIRQDGLRTAVDVAAWAARLAAACRACAAAGS